MSDYCVCGKRLESLTSCNPYLSATYDSKGNVIKGICIHGIKIGNWEETEERDNGYTKI